MPRGKMNTYLVFECVGNTSGAPDSHYHAMGQSVPTRDLMPYNCVGAVRAEDEMQAVQAVMAYTRRISKYAVVLADVIDFQPGTDDQAEGRRVELNP